MRWFWIDRFIEFERGRRAVALKNVSLSEDPLGTDSRPLPTLPSSLIVEGIAQTGGLLVGESSGFADRVVLAKVGKAVFHRSAGPGDTLRYTAVVEDIRPDGSIIKGTSHIGDELQAEVDLVFAHLDDRFDGVDLFYPDQFIGMLRIFGLYDVGRDEHGQPLEIPEYLVEAERRKAAGASTS